MQSCGRCNYLFPRRVGRRLSVGEYHARGARVSVGLDFALGRDVEELMRLKSRRRYYDAFLSNNPTHFEAVYSCQAETAYW